MDTHAFIHVPVPFHKTIPMHQTKYAGTIGNLDPIQDDTNNHAHGNNNNRETQRPIVKCGKRLWP